MNYTILVSFLSGGAAGAVINVFFTRRFQKRELTLKIIDGFFVRYTEIAAVKGLLAPGALSNPAQKNQVRAIGDWFDHVARLFNGCMLDKKLFKGCGIDKEIIEFRTRAQRSGNCDEELKVWSALQSFAST